MVTINNQYKHSDDSGSYTVCFGDHTIEMKFNGFLSEQLVEKFCEDLELILKFIEWKYWGYYGDLTECDEQLAKISDVLVDLHKRFLQHGCIVDAYTVINPMAVEQLIKLREAADITLNNNLFPTRQQAMDFIHNVLFKVKEESIK